MKTIHISNHSNGIGDAITGLYLATALVKQGYMVQYGVKPACLPWLQALNANPAISIANYVPGVGIDIFEGFDNEYTGAMQGKWATRYERYEENLDIYLAGKTISLKPEKPQCTFTHQCQLPRIIINPYASNAGRNWPATHYAHLARLLMQQGFEITLLCSAEQVSMVNHHFKGMDASLRVVCHMGQPPHEVMKLMQDAFMFIGNDSGMLHLAAAIGLPCLAIVSQLPARFVFGHITGTVLSPASPMPCSPCYKSSQNYSPDCGRLGCSALAAISPWDVFNSVRNYARGRYVPRSRPMRQNVTGPYLGNVTLVCIDCQNHQAAWNAIEHSYLMHRGFFDAIFFTDKPDPAHADSEITTQLIEPLESREAYSHFVMKKLVDYIKTSHVLIVQHDGYILNGQLWDNRWLQYDYMGAPWWYTDGQNVGNGGFSLRSARLLRELQKDKYVETHPEDHHIGRTYRQQLEERGFIFAPESEAARFSFEHSRKYTLFDEHRHYGFHKVPGYVINNDHNQLTNRYAGQKCYIVGKGPSLQYLQQGHIGPGPVIALYQAIQAVEQLNLPNPGRIFSMQKDGNNNGQNHCNQQCNQCSLGVAMAPQQATLLVHAHESSQCLPAYAPRLVFDNLQLGLRKIDPIVLSAVQLGRLMGCTKFVLISCDSMATGNHLGYIPGVGVVDTEPASGRAIQARNIAAFLKLHAIDYKLLIPTEQKAVAQSVNIPEIRKNEL